MFFIQFEKDANLLSVIKCLFSVYAISWTFVALSVGIFSGRFLVGKTVLNPENRVVL